MHNFWKGLARFFAILFAIGFILTAVLSLWLVAFDQRLLNAATYESALDRQQVYARLPGLLAEQLVMSVSYNPCSKNPLSCEGASPEFLDCARTMLGPERFQALSTGQGQPSEVELQHLQPCLQKYGTNLTQGSGDSQAAGGPPSYLRSLSAADWERILSQLLPPATLRFTTVGLIDQVFAYLDGRRDTVVLDLTGVKQQISGPGGLDAITELIRSQPPCTGQQLEQTLAWLITGQGEMVLCRPPDDVLELMKPLLQMQLKSIVKLIPDTKVLLSPASGGNSSNSGPLSGGLPGILRLARLIMRLSPALPVGFLLLVTLFAVRTVKGWLRWWGIPVFISGVLALILAILALVSFEETWGVLLANRIPAYISQGVTTLGHDFARTILQTYLSSIAIAGTVLTLAGLGMWIGSTFIKEEAKTVTSAAPVPPPV